MFRCLLSSVEVRRRAAAALLVGCVACAASTVVAALADEQLPLPAGAPAGEDFRYTLENAMVRLPLAAVLGTALALRPKRKGTPKRTPAVVQTQIILAIVGAVIMLVVGASLARAFGIVGAANLIRYRSKIDDPKDAVVMLCALAVGLAAGVGLYSLATFSTAFIVAALAAIESFEPKALKPFELAIKLGKGTDKRRPKIEAILKRYGVEFELRTTSDEELAYRVKVPLELDTELVTDAIRRIGADGSATVEWAEKKPKDK